MSDGSFLQSFLGEDTMAPQNNTVAEAYRQRSAQLAAQAKRRKMLIWLLVGIAVAVAVVFLVRYLKRRQQEQVLISWDDES